MRYLIISITLLSLISCSNNKQPESYDAGFQIIHSVDKSRIYKPNTDTTNYLHYRPLDIDMWYPAQATATDSTLFFRDLLGLLAARANYYTASNAGNGMTQQIAQYMCTQLKCSDTTKVLSFKTHTFKDAPPVTGKFPLVIYLCSYNGMSYENYLLFEKLAEKGFVVVSISSIGRYPGDMTMKYGDLMQQVDDAIASLKSLKKVTDIDFSKIGIVGYSWGGLAGSILASKISNVKCLISLDGSEFHQYGSSKEEDADFDGIRYNDEFKNMRISAPYLRLESSPLGDTTKQNVDSVYNFSEKLSARQQIFEVDSARHGDFSCLPTVVYESGNCKHDQRFQTSLKLTLSFLEDHLKNENTFSQVVEQDINKTIREK